ncbi:MAG: hypothetical protein Q4F97_06870 [Bacteroidales bacterium]|nr:hypothetical protein [Bacteroidales bacterium]
MKKSIFSLSFVLFVCLSFFGCSSSSSSKLSNTSTKVSNIATVTKNVLAITGTSTGNSAVDNLLTKTASLLNTYETINSGLDAIQVIKNGATTSITDGSSALSKVAALTKLSGITTQLGSLAKETATTATEGASLLKTLSASAVSSNQNVKNTVETINNVKVAVDALSALGVAVPASVQNASSKISALKSATGL